MAFSWCWTHAKLTSARNDQTVHVCSLSLSLSMCVYVCVYTMTSMDWMKCTVLSYNQIKLFIGWKILMKEPFFCSGLRNNYFCFIEESDVFKTVCILAARLLRLCKHVCDFFQPKFKIQIADRTSKSDSHWQTCKFDFRVFSFCLSKW